MADLQNEPLSFEKVWAMFQETDRKFQESDRKFQVMSQETREQMKETDRRIGELGNRFGEIAEHLVLPGIMEKFNNLGFNFTKDALDARFRDPKTRQILAEVDILLENGDIVIAVEIKSKLREKDVDKHLLRMEVLRRHADSGGDTRRYRGAIAGAIVTDGARKYAQEAGFYVLEQSGDTMKLDIPKGFVPRDF